ncbi:WS/DGAT domain-containing protein [Streptomyces sp. NPDC093225]|uniref:WS/DGAT domain-containing protein n=1 Tax=Streptomyces sp. NPDC093225 TaxID=3366034 RepID=UPI0037F8C2A6
MTGMDQRRRGLPRISPLDCAFLNYGHIHGARQTSAGFLLLMDGEPPGRSELIRHVQERVDRYPALSLGFGLDRPRLLRPRWQQIRNVDASRLVFECRTTPAVPMLQDLAGRCMGELPTASDVPLWSLGLLHGTSGEWALLFRCHHAAYDAAHTQRALRWLLAPDPVAEERGGVTRPAWSPMVRQSIRGLVSMGRGLLRNTAPQVPALRAGAEEPCRITWAHSPLATFRDIARKHDVTVNTVFLTALTLALRRHLEAGGSSVPDAVIATVPMMLPGNTSRLPVGNNIACTRLRLPLRLTDAHECLRHLHEMSTVAKRNGHREGGRATVRLGHILPARAAGVLLTAAVHPRWSNLVATNVGMVEGPLACGRAEVRAAVVTTIRPPGGGLTASVATYKGTVTVAFTVDRRTDPHLDLPRHYAAALEELRR